MEAKRHRRQHLTLVEVEDALVETQMMTVEAEAVALVDRAVVSLWERLRRYRALRSSRRGRVEP